MWLTQLMDVAREPVMELSFTPAAPSPSATSQMRLFE
jgi:hypothetical protein